MKQGPDFDAYANVAQRYLNRLDPHTGQSLFRGTPLTGQMLANGAKQTYLQTGTIVPVELALSQAQIESSMGRTGRNPITNPFNVGEFDAGTTQKFQWPQNGVNAYYNLMANDYLKGRTADDLKKNFVNSKGLRYASNPKYESQVGDQMDFIRNHYLNTQPGVNQ